MLLWLSLYGLSYTHATELESLGESAFLTLFEWDETLFGYDDVDRLSVSDISSSSISFSSPVLEDTFFTKIKDYILLYGRHSMDELLSDFQLLSNFTEVEFSHTDNGSTLTMTLDSNLDRNSIYYVVAIPRDDYGTLWSVSNEICFRLSDGIYGEWSECVDGAATSSSTSSNHTSNSWTNAIALANVSCTWDGKKVTVSWVPTSNVWNVYISLYNESTKQFDRKGTVNANNDRTFSFNVNQSTAPIVRFDDTDGLSAYKDYTCHRLDTSTPTTTTTTGTKTKVTTVPTVWPKENILAVIAWAIILYVFYRVTRRKAD